jgi:hypothetical protein
MFGEGLNVRLALGEGETARLSGQKSMRGYTGQAWLLQVRQVKGKKSLTAKRARGELSRLSTDVYQPRGVRPSIGKTMPQLAKCNEPMRRFVPKREPHACCSRSAKNLMAISGGAFSIALLISSAASLSENFHLARLFGAIRCRVYRPDDVSDGEGIFARPSAHRTQAPATRGVQPRTAPQYRPRASASTMAKADK